jgi:hypothetical protein
LDDLAPDALQRLLPYLGPLVGAPERVDGEDPDHPGQTFDYFAERTDGRRLAIEVTRAWDNEWLEAEPAWRKLAAEVKAAAQQRDQTINGFYAMATRRRGNPRAKEYEAAALADALAECFDAGVGAEIAVDDVLRFRYVQDRPGLVIESARGVAEFESGPESRPDSARRLHRSSTPCTEPEPPGTRRTSPSSTGTSARRTVGVSLWPRRLPKHGTRSASGLSI